MDIPNEESEQSQTETLSGNTGGGLRGVDGRQREKGLEF